MRGRKEGKQKTRAAQRPRAARASGLREGGGAASRGRTGNEKRSRADAIGIVGLGLIGGSFAKALSARYPRRPLIGVEPDTRTRALARRSGIFETLLPRPSKELRRCGIVILCAPVPAILRLLGTVSRAMRDGAILTDVGSVKGPVAQAARARVRRGVSFVGAHPMFGGETGGYAAGRGELWSGGAVAVCTDSPNRTARETIARLHRALGARVVFCTSAEHDAAVAAVSHLPYVVAGALALTATEAGPLARHLAGKGLVGATRLAAFSYGVQGRAVQANAYLPRATRSFQRNLRKLLHALVAPTAKARAAFVRARRFRKSLVS